MCLRNNCLLEIRLAVVQHHPCYHSIPSPHLLHTQPQRRKVSVEGEKVAKRVVEGTGGAGENSDGFAMHEHDEIQDYYR
jgi:hypothetical protein